MFAIPLVVYNTSSDTYEYIYTIHYIPDGSGLTKSLLLLTKASYLLVDPMLADDVRVRTGFGFILFSIGRDLFTLASPTRKRSLPDF